MSRISRRGKTELSSSQKAFKSFEEEVENDSFHRREEESEEGYPITEDEDSVGDNDDISSINPGSPGGVEDIYSSQVRRDHLRRQPIKRDESISEESSSPPHPKRNSCIKSNSELIQSPPNPAFKESSPISLKESLRKNTHSEPKEVSPAPFKIKHVVCFTFIAILSLLLMVSHFHQESRPDQEVTLDLLSWNNHLLNLKKDFPSISNLKAVNVSASKLYGKLKQPGVLLLMGETAESANCFAQKLLSYFDAKPLDVQNLLKLHPDPIDLKDDLYYSFNARLMRKRVVGLLNIDRLSGQSAMVLHSYCDNENAPFPQSFIVLTLTFPKGESFEPLLAEQVIEEELVKKWTDNLTFDKATAVVNRVIGYSAYVPVESMGPCSA